MNYIIIVTDCDCIVSFYSFHGTEKDIDVYKRQEELIQEPIPILFSFQNARI